MTPRRNPVSSWRGAFLAVPLALWLAVANSGGDGRPSPGAVRREVNLVYADGSGVPRKLDLYLPQLTASRGLLIWIHGGAWREGSKDSPPISSFTRDGYAVASVDYRLSPAARFPAQVHDIKAAIRFLRARSLTYGYDARRIAILGASAGGHLAALVGVTNRNAELEGREGSNLDQDSDVQAVVSYFGGSDLTTILAQSTPAGLALRRPALQQLLGGLPDELPALSRLASPVFHVDGRAVPLLLLHDDQDSQMPVEQAYELMAAYQAHGLVAQFVLVPGAGHGGKEFFDDQRNASVRAFLERALGP